MAKEKSLFRRLEDRENAVPDGDSFFWRVLARSTERGHSYEQFMADYYDKLLSVLEAGKGSLFFCQDVGCFYLKNPDEATLKEIARMPETVRIEFREAGRTYQGELPEVMFSYEKHTTKNDTVVVSPAPKFDF